MYTRQEKAALLARLKSRRRACLSRLMEQARELENEVEHLTLRRLNAVSYSLRSVKIKTVLHCERSDKHTVQTLIEAIRATNKDMTNRIASDGASLTR